MYNCWSVAKLNHEMSSHGVTQDDYDDDYLSQDDDDASEEKGGIQLRQIEPTTTNKGSLSWFSFATLQQLYIYTISLLVTLRWAFVPLTVLYGYQLIPVQATWVNLIIPTSVLKFLESGVLDEQVEQMNMPEI